MPYIALKTGARGIGTESTANVAGAESVPEKQIQIVKDGEKLELWIQCDHSTTGIGECERSASLRPTRRRRTLAYVFSIGGHRIIVFGSMNYIEGELAALRPDVALIGAMAERDNIDDNTARLIRGLGKPPIVIATHWDRFNVPYSVSQEPPVRRLKSFIEE